MKKIKYLVVVSLLLVFIQFYGMKRKYQISSEQPTIEAFFVPQNHIRDPLYILLDSAKWQVLVAMYRITDRRIVEKLIKVKERGVDVKIIFDESGFRNDILNKFLENGIVPIIFPTLKAEVMHNKFVVVDDNAVLTGSANFTRPAFYPTSSSYNYENIVVLRSSDIVKQYKKAFVDIEKQTFNIYMDLIATRDLGALPNWFNRLFSELYKRDFRIQELRISHMNKYKKLGKERLKQFFDSLPVKEFYRPTQLQKSTLGRYGVLTDGMSKEEATELIDTIFKKR